MNLSYRLGINFEHKGREVDFTACGYPCPSNTTRTRASRRSIRWLFAQAPRSVLRPLLQCQPRRATSCCATRRHHAARTRARPRANAPHSVPCSGRPARTQPLATAAGGAREAPEKRKPSEKGDGCQPPRAATARAISPAQDGASPQAHVSPFWGLISHTQLLSLPQEPQWPVA